MGSCVGLAQANQVGMETGFPVRVPTEPAKEAWLCLVVDLMCAKQWGGKWGTPKVAGACKQGRAAGHVNLAMHAGQDVLQNCLAEQCGA